MELSALFSYKTDEQLVACVDRLLEKKYVNDMISLCQRFLLHFALAAIGRTSGADIGSLLPTTFNPSKEELMHYKLIENFTIR